MQTPGEKDFVVELANLFLQDTDEKLRKLREAIAQGRSDDLAEMAHALKGNSANLGAARLSGLCAKLEALGKTEEAADALRLLASIEKEFTRVRFALLKQTGGTNAACG